MQAPVDISYLADTVILLRYFEAAGEVRKAISVVKKPERPPRAHDPRAAHRPRTGSGSARELREFHGVLTGRLEYTGRAEPLLQADSTSTSKETRRA